MTHYSFLLFLFKVYGISDKELQSDSLENGVITRIATKDAS